MSMLKPLRKLFLGTGLILFLSLPGGCTVLTSETPRQLLEGPQEGVLYSLPLSVVDLTLSADKDGKLTLQADPARSIADPRKRFVLRYQPLPNYDDKITIGVSPNSFLKQAKVETVDRTPQVFINFVRLFSRISGGFEEGVVAAPIVLSKVTVNPTDASDLERGLLRLNQAVVGYAKSATTDCAKIPNTEYAQKAICLRNKRMVITGEAWIALGDGKRLIPDNLRTAPVQFWIKPSRPTVIDSRDNHIGTAVRARPKVRNQKSLAVTDCTVGICYRPPLPYHVWYSVGADPSERFGERPGVQARIEFLPNDSPIVAIDIQRTFFGRKMLDINFDLTSGFLTSFEVQKDSEILALAKLPIQILKATLSVLQFRAHILLQETNEAEAMDALISTRRQLAEQQRLLESAIAQAEADQGQATLVSTVPLPEVVQSSVGRDPTVLLPRE